MAGSSDNAPPFSEKDLDELFAAEPSDFVAARAALVKRLRQGGDREAAAEVAKLRKPTAVAWALNQLTRREGGQVDALLRTDERMRGLMQSGGRATELRAASAERKDIVRGLARVASAILAGAGHKATPSAGEKIFETLQAVATDPEAREALRRGRLAGDVQPSGFGEDLVAGPASAAAGGAGSQAAGATEAGDDTARRAQRAQELRLLVAEARRTARRRAGEAQELRRAAERLARDAAEAERLARRARKDADRAAATLDQAVQASEEATRVLAELEAEQPE